MNLLRKFENILEQVDSQAAKQIEQLKSPTAGIRDDFEDTSLIDEITSDLGNVNVEKEGETNLDGEGDGFHQEIRVSEREQNEEELLFSEKKIERKKEDQPELLNVKSQFEALQKKTKLLATRYQKLQSEYKSTTKKMAEMNQQNKTYLTTIERLKNSQTSMNSLLLERETQIENLQTKLQEKMDQCHQSELLLKQYDISSKESETSKRSYIESLEDKLRILEQRLSDDTNSLTSVKLKDEERIRELEMQIADFANNFQVKQKENEELNYKLNTLNTNIRKYEKECSLLRNELKIYKKKAASVLHQKEEEILNLTKDFNISLDSNGNGNGSNSHPSTPKHQKPLRRISIDDYMNDSSYNGGGETLRGSSSGSDLSLELEESFEITRSEFEKLFHENRSLTEENYQLDAKYRELSQTLLETEALARDERDSMQASINDAVDEIRKYKIEIQKLLDELKEKNNAILGVSQQSEFNEKKLRKEIEDRNKEIDKLNKKIKSKMMQVTNEEMEERIQQLSETLLSKQSLIHSLSSELSALRNAYTSNSSNNSNFYSRSGEVLVDLRSNASYNNSMHDKEESRDKENQRMTSLLTLFPALAYSDSVVAKGYTYIASKLDKLSLDFASIMRVYPVFRLIFIIYMAVLHLWLISFVLKTSAGMEELPENP